MGIFSWLFKKKKDEVPYYLEDDGQSQYFKDSAADKAESAVKDVAEDKSAKAEVAAAPAAAPAKDVAEDKSAKAEVAAAPAAAPAKKKSAAKPKAEKEAEATAEVVAPATEIAEETAPQPKGAKTGRYEIKKTKDGRYVFNLYALNSVIVATSQVYSSAQSALNGIESIIVNAPKANVEDQSLKNPSPKNHPKWEIYIDNAGQYRFRLNAPNGSCIVHSQGYTTKSACKNGIDSIIRCSVNPEIDKSYLKAKDEK